MVTWGGLPRVVPRLRRAVGVGAGVGVVAAAVAVVAVDVGVVAVVVGVVAEGSALGPEGVAGELCPILRFVMYIWLVHCRPSTVGACQHEVL